MKRIDTSRLTRRGFLGTSLGVVGTVILTACGSDSSGESSNTPPSLVEIKIEDEKRVVITNGYPKHQTGEFPNPTCPYGIGSDAMFRFEMPKNPQPRVLSPQSIYEYYHRFGVGVNGITFDPAGPAWDGNNVWHVEVLSFTASRHLGVDGNNAHVQPYDREGGADDKDGEYHYHGFPEGLFNLLYKEDIENKTNKKMFLLGYGADGYPIYAPEAPIDPNDENSQLITLQSSYKLKEGLRVDIEGQGKRPAGNYDGTFVEDYKFDSDMANSGDEFLDEFNGRFGVTNEYPEGTYYYVITKSFPFIPRKFKGELLPPVAGEPTFENMNFVHPQAPTAEQIPQALKDYPSA